MTKTGADSAPQGGTTPEEALRRLVQTTELVDIRTTKYAGEVFSSERRRPGAVSFTATPAYRLKEDGFDCKYVVCVPIQDRGEGDLANLEIDIVASFTTTAAEPPDGTAVQQFMERVAYFVVMPFIREAVQSLTVKLGLEPLTLGLLHSDSPAPMTATARPRGTRE